MSRHTRNREVVSVFINAVSDRRLYLSRRSVLCYGGGQAGAKPIEQCIPRGEGKGELPQHISKSAAFDGGH